MHDYESFGEPRVRHLEMIQRVIDRLSGATFLTKRWSFALTAVLLSFALQQRVCQLAVVSAAVTLAFWILDQDFLRSERLFRLFYEHVRTTDEPDPYFMDAAGEKFMSVVKEAGLEERIGRWKVFRSRTLALPYGVQIVVAGLVLLFLRLGLMT